MRNPVFVILTAWILAVTPPWEASALTVDDAVQMAQARNLGMATESLKVAQKADEKNFSFNRLYPSISTNATVVRLNNLNMSQWKSMWPLIANNNLPFSAVTGNLTEDSQWNLSLGVNIQFLWSPAVFRGIAQTLVDYDNAVLNRNAASARLERDVRKAFFQLLALHEASTVLEAQLRVAEDRYRLAKLNSDAGLGSEIAKLQAQVALENRRPVVADQKLTEANALAGFRILLNLPDDAPLDLQGTLEVSEAERIRVMALDGEALVKGHAETRYDVSTAQGAVKSLSNLADLQADTLLPSLIVGYSMDPTVNAPFKDSNWSDTSKYAQSSGSLMVGLGWKLDGLLPGSTTGLAIENLRRQTEQTRLAVEQTRRAGEAEIRALVGKAKKSATSLDGLALALTLAQRSSKLTEAGYQTGNQSFSDTQDADLQLQTARLQFLNEELALTSTLADLDFALAAHRSQWLGEDVHG